MDPITVAIVTALAVLANASLGEAAKKGTADAYEALKQRIRRKYGNSTPPLLDSAVPQPASEESARTLDEQVTALGMSSDPELADAAKRLSAAASIGSVSSNITVSAETIVGGIGGSGPTTYHIGSIGGAGRR